MLNKEGELSIIDYSAPATIPRLEAFKTLVADLKRAAASADNEYVAKLLLNTDPSTIVVKRCSKSTKVQSRPAVEGPRSAQR